MTFPRHDEGRTPTSLRILDQGMRVPAWITITVLLCSIGLVAPVVAINDIGSGRAAAWLVAVAFLLTGFIAFNFDLTRSRLYVALVWGGIGLGLLAGGHEGQTVSWLILAIGALIGAEILCRACGVLRSAAVTDPLTGLQNRTGLIAECDRAITICRRLDQPLTLAHLDLDGFKEINDREGHAEGDRILRQCADAWTGVVRQGDILARIGGDEFLLVLPGSDSNDARRLMGLLKEVSPIDWSFGVAELGLNEELQACVDRADAELYAQKGLRR